VRFLKDPYTPERLRRMGLNERQVKAVLHVKQHGSIGNKEYQDLTGASKPTVTRDLDAMVRLGILTREGGRGRGVRYRIKASERAQRAHNRLRKGSTEGQEDPE
jgi:ATP-dependent DNA helicase RecG